MALVQNILIRVFLVNLRPKFLCPIYLEWSCWDICVCRGLAFIDAAKWSSTVVALDNFLKHGTYPVSLPALPNTLQYPITGEIRLS